MKEFLVGLIFLIAVLILAGTGVLLMPLWMLLEAVIRTIFILVFIIFCIWLLGKFIIFVWGKVKDR